MSNFEWCTLYLLEHNASLYEEIERLMADSKFFRGLFVVFIILGMLKSFVFTEATKLDFNISLTSIYFTIGVCAFMSLLLYIHVRNKCTKKLYSYVVYMEELRISKIVEK